MPSAINPVPTWMIGDAANAIDFAVGHCEPEEAVAFLDDWRSDRASKWLGYISWLDKQRQGAAEARATKQRLCAHDWNYRGTDYHGSHKGEDSYECRKCGKSEYRHD